MRTLFYIVLALGVTLSAFGQRRDMTPEQRRERVETVIIGKFADELELSPEEAEKFYPRLRQFRSETEQLQRDLAETRHRIDEISRANDQPSTVKKSETNSTERSNRYFAGSQLSESPEKGSDIEPEEDIKTLITRSNALQTEILDKRETLLTDLADFLSPQQVSRCSILLDELPRRIRQFMDERGAPEERRERMRSDDRRRRTR